MTGGRGDMLQFHSLLDPSERTKTSRSSYMVILYLIELESVLRMTVTHIKREEKLIIQMMLNLF